MLFRSLNDFDLQLLKYSQENSKLLSKIVQSPEKFQVGHFVFLFMFCGRHKVCQETDIFLLESLC